jgi:FMN phosphatase YigB (HAD superfamily)
VSNSKAQAGLFDLDHTLLPIDSDYAWGVFTTTSAGPTRPFRRRNDEFYAHYQAGTLDIHDYVRFATEAVRLQGPAKRQPGRTRASCARWCSPSCRPEALALVHSTRPRAIRW